MSDNLRSDIQFLSRLEHEHPHDGYYEGQLLIATPYMRGEIFAGGVIYVFAHNAGGAMGVLINKPLEMVHYAALFQQLGLPVSSSQRDITVYHGGPVEENRGFVLHSSDYALEDTLQHECGIYVTASLQVLRDMAIGQGPKEGLLAIGYAGWAAGQLEAEIEANLWVSVPAISQVVFHSDDSEKYGLAAKTIGVDMHRISPMVGHA
jgi:putative transcriptional regulator